MAGHRISLDEIDEKVMNEINVRCVSSGTDDHLVIFVLSEEDERAVEDYVRPSFRVVLIDEFPVNEAGKILYGALLETARQQI